MTGFSAPTSAPEDIVALAASHSADSSIAISVSRVRAPEGICRTAAMRRSYRAVVRAWDLSTGRRIGKPITGGPYGNCHAVATAVTDGNHVGILGANDGVIRLFDPVLQTQLGELPFRHEGWTSAVSVGEVNGLQAVISGGSDGVVAVSDLSSGRAIGLAHRTVVHPIVSVALGEIDGRVVGFYLGSGDSQVRYFDIHTGRDGLSVDFGSSISALTAQGSKVVAANFEGIAAIAFSRFDTPNGRV
jgi:WD40 repeat protein